MSRMKDVQHTNADDAQNVFGAYFRRGPTTVTDGGTPTETPREGAADEAADEQGSESMKDISHTAADEDRNPNRVWSRGSEDEVQEE